LYRAPVGPLEKLRVGHFLLQVARWRSATMGRELWNAVCSGCQRLAREIPLALKRSPD
jgi:hypothetical protein